MCFLKEKIHIKYRITENDLIKNKTASLLEPHTNFNSKHNTPKPGSTEYIEEKSFPCFLSNNIYVIRVINPYVSKG